MLVLYYFHGPVKLFCSVRLVFPKCSMRANLALALSFPNGHSKSISLPLQKNYGTQHLLHHTLHNFSAAHGERAQRISNHFTTLKADLPSSASSGQHVLHLSSKASRMGKCSNHAPLFTKATMGRYVPCHFHSFNDQAKAGQNTLSLPMIWPFQFRTAMALSIPSSSLPSLLLTLSLQPQQSHVYNIFTTIPAAEM